MPLRALNGVQDVDENAWQPADHGFKAWAYDPASCNSAVALATAGRIYVTKLIARQPMSISSAWFSVQTAGAALTNVGVAVYSSAGTLLGSSVNANGATAAAFQTTGDKQVTFTAINLTTPQFWVGIWATGTTMPALARAGNQFAINANIAAASARFGQGPSGLTTAAPSPLGTVTAGGQAYWAAAA